MGGEHLKKTCFAILFLWLFSGVSLAEAKELIPMGNSIGIVLQLNQVVFTQDVYVDEDKWIVRGDELEQINQQKIQTMKQFVSSIQDENELAIHGEKGNYTLKLNLQKTEELAHFMADTTEGIGTLTYVDPETSTFGALGHQILDQSKQAPKFKRGEVFDVDIKEIKKSEAGLPGFKVAKVKTDNKLGIVLQNELYGVFGNWLADTNKSLHQPLEIMYEKDVKIGKATILTALQNNEVREYEIEIESIKDGVIQFKVTDAELIKQTGGIVQGMSGSPILQNNQFVGAVTHMYVEEPTKGVGLMILEMLDKR